MDEQNTFNLDPNQQPQAAQPINPDPLNTGNGGTTPAAPAPAPMPQNIPATNTPQEIAAAPTPTPAPAPTPSTTGEKSMKKYLIIAIGAILGITIIFIAFKLLTGNDEAETTNTEAPPAIELNNTLSENSEEREELEEIVEELKDIYPEESPPSLTLDLSETAESEETEKTTPTNNSEKIAR